jgi:hypothetical protein
MQFILAFMLGAGDVSASSSHWYEPHDDLLTLLALLYCILSDALATGSVSNGHH